MTTAISPCPGGGFDLLYDEGALELVSVTLAPREPDVQWSWAGSSDVPGIISNVGHGTKFFNGISSSGEFITVVFNVLSAEVGDPGCDGFQLCLLPTPLNPFVDLTGFPPSEDVLMDAYASVVTVPLPAGIWLFGECLLGVFGLRKRA